MRLLQIPASLFCQATNVAKALVWGLPHVVGTHSSRPSSCAGWIDGEECGYVYVSIVCYFVCVRAVAWPEGAHSNSHPPGRKRENDETEGREAG